METTPLGDVAQPAVAAALDHAPAGVLEARVEAEDADAAQRSGADQAESRCITASATSKLA